MYNPCYNCPRPNIIRVDEGRESLRSKDDGDYYDALICPEICSYGVCRAREEELEQKLQAVALT